jgi:hypothetical protein
MVAHLYSREVNHPENEESAPPIGMIGYGSADCQGAFGSWVESENIANGSSTEFENSRSHLSLEKSRVRR